MHISVCERVSVEGRKGNVLEHRTVQYGQSESVHGCVCHGSTVSTRGPPNSGVA